MLTWWLPGCIYRRSNFLLHVSHPNESDGMNLVLSFETLMYLTKFCVVLRLENGKV